MRYRVWLAGLLCLGGCAHPAGTATLVLVNKYWDHVNVQAVITRSSDCDNRGEGYLSTKEFAMGKGQTYSINAPNGAEVCWRHDPDPNNPQKGVWSGWSRAVLYPGQEFETDM
jgi:hypothetical protein